MAKLSGVRGDTKSLKRMGAIRDPNRAVHLWFDMLACSSRPLWCFRPLVVLTVLRDTCFGDFPNLLNP